MMWVFFGLHNIIIYTCNLPGQAFGTRERGTVLYERPRFFFFSFLSRKAVPSDIGMLL